MELSFLFCFFGLWPVESGIPFYVEEKHPNFFDILGRKTEALRCVTKLMLLGGLTAN